MSATLFVLPRQVKMNLTGIPYAGAQAFFYQTGTQTPQPVFQDSGLTIPHSFPVLANDDGYWPVIWLDSSAVANYQVRILSADNVELDNIQNISRGLSIADLGLTQQALGQISTPRTAQEIAAGITPTSYAHPVDSVLRYGAVFNNVADDTTALNTAIQVGKQTLNGAVGDVVRLPLGTAVLSSQVTLPNDVRFLGTNKNGSIFKAVTGWNSGTSPNMFYAVNSGISMFDSIMESLTIDCNNVPGLNAIRSDAWQNNSGPRRCLIFNFTNYGLWVHQGDGGADILPLEDVEIFGSSTITAVAGIRVEKVSQIGNFVLHVNRAVIAGSTAHLLPRGIDMAYDGTFLEKVFWENCTTGLYIDGAGSHVLINCAAAETVTNLVEIASTFVGSLRMIGCRRGGAAVLIKDNRVGGLGTFADDMADFTIATPTGFSVSGISQAASAVVTLSTVSGSNPVFVGSQLRFVGNLGMTQINGLVGTVSAIGGSSGAWTATTNINSSGFSAYTSGGGVYIPAFRAVSADNTIKAWCTFDGTTTGTHAPTEGFNVKSVTRNSVGNYAVNFTNNLLSANAAISVITGLDSVSVPAVATLGNGVGSSQFTVRLAGVLTDSTLIHFMIVGKGT